VFTVPSGAIKCAGAPQKIAYLASDYWRKQGVLNDIDVHLVMPGPRPFGIPAIADSLDAVIADYGITLHSNSEVTSVDAASHKVAITSVGPGGTDTMLPYDVLHAVPRQSAPDWIKSSPLSTGDAVGYVEIEKHTMQHVRYPNVFSLGDAGSSPNSKTGAAIRKQAPVVVDNIDAFLKRQPLRASYDGYSSCPIVTSSHAMLLAEFDYDLRLEPSFPLLDPTKPHRAYWYLKKYGLPFMYWNLMLKGLA
jgi:sulfide:quinone oxidoreductase